MRQVQIENGPDDGRVPSCIGGGRDPTDLQVHELITVTRSPSRTDGALIEVKELGCMRTGRKAPELTQDCAVGDTPGLLFLFSVSP
jgi:hypothetical protein